MKSGTRERGSAVIELGLVSEAAYAGAQYGSQAGNSSNFTTMQTIATNSAKGVSGFSAAAMKWCACSPGGTAVSCGATCPGYGMPVAYVQVITTATATVLFKYGDTALGAAARGLRFTSAMSGPGMLPEG